MPLASPPGRPDVVYGFGRIDASGRVADRVTIAALGWRGGDRVTIAALGWRGGDRLTVTADAGVMIARRDPGGMVTVAARPYVVIPAALRRRCGLRAGDHVLLAASPDQDTLAAYSFAVVDQALRAHAPDCATGGGHDRRASGGFPAGGGEGGADAAGADGPDPGRPGRRLAVPPEGADLRRVRPDRVGGGQRLRASPSGARHLLS